MWCLSGTAILAAARRSSSRRARVRTVSIARFFKIVVSIAQSRKASDAIAAIPASPKSSSLSMGKDHFFDEPRYSTGHEVGPCGALRGPSRSYPLRLYQLAGRAVGVGMAAVGMA